MSCFFVPKNDTQRGTTKLDQVALPLSGRPEPADVADSTLLKQTDMLAAIRLAIQESGLQDNQIYPVLRMEKAAFSKALGGSNHFPSGKLDQLCDVLGNEVVLRWWALRRGYGLVKLKSTLEEENEQLRADLHEARRDLDKFREFVRQTR